MVPVTLAALLCLGATARSNAQTATVKVLLDLDNNPTTGCIVETPLGAFWGADQVLVTTVDIPNARVISVARQVCTAGVLGSPAMITSPYAPTWPVGLRNGTGGGDVVETYFPLGLTGLTSDTSVRLGFVVTNQQGDGSAILPASTVALPAQPKEAIPALSSWGVAALGLSLASIAVFLLARRGTRPLAICLALALGAMAAGAAVSTIVLDGQTDDWAGIAPLGSSPGGVGPSNADILAAFAEVQNGILFLRIDATIICQGITVSPDTLGAAVVGQPYGPVTLTQTGGAGSVTWDETGSLPTGLAFAGGVLSGTPTQAGSFPITVKAADANGCAGSQGYVLSVSCSGVTIDISPSSLVAATVGSAYPSVTFSAGGGTGSYAYVEAGTLPAGMTFSSGTLSGTPTQSGTFPFTVSATDQAGCSASRGYSFSVVCPTIGVTPGAVPAGATGAAYSPVTFGASGGVGPYTYAETGALPQGMTFANGVLSGTPTQTGTFPITVTASDGHGCGGSQAVALVVNCGTVTVSPSTLAAGTSGVAYPSVTFAQTGGAAPVTWSETGALPAGMTLSSGGLLSGTPTQTGSYAITVAATDTNKCTGSQSLTLTVACAAIAVSPSTLAAATEGVAYPSATFTQSGGVAPVTWSESGTLPQGMRFAGGVLSGTPTQTGSFTFTVTATDANRCTGSQSLTLTVNCPGMTVSPSTLNAATEGAAYPSVTFTQTGGVAPVTWSETGVLPQGMTFSGSVLSGTPTQTGSFQITVTATDANRCTGSQLLTLTVNCAAMTVSPSTLNAATEGIAYPSVTFTQTGGVTPVTWSESGPLPQGMTFAGAVLSGTPMQTGSFPITVTTTDANGCTGSRPLTLTVNCGTIAVSPSTLAAATAGATYPPVTFTQSGGVGAIGWTETGALPAGMAFTNGVLSGTPTATGSFPITFEATDANACTGARAITLAVGCPTIAVSPSTLSAATEGAAYPSVTFRQSGGVGSIAWSESGALPQGMTFVGGVLSGTPTRTGSFTFTVKATDANGCTGTQSVTLAVNCATISVSPPVLPGGTSGHAYGPVTFTQTAGVGTITWSETGSLPAGVTFSGNQLSGTPTQSGSFPITVKATDANGCTGSQSYVLTVSCSGVAIVVAPSSVGAATVGSAYSAVTFNASGGTAPYTYGEAGTLPAGMTFSAGTLSGIPTRPGTFPFTVSAADSVGCSGSQGYFLVVSCPTITVTPGSVAAGTVGSAYTSVTFGASGGSGSYTFSENGALPAGMTFSGGVLAGTPTQKGTFPITVIATDANGCTGSQVVSLIVNCPTIAVSPTSVPSATAGTAYSPATFSSTGGVGNVTWSGSGALPTGMTFSSGVLSGTPTQKGTFPITVTATDANGCTGSQSVSLLVSCATITVYPTSLPLGIAGVALPTVTFGAQGSVGVVTWSSTGSLPTGVTFSSGGVLSGTPTQTGSFPVTYVAADSLGCTGSRQLTLTVQCGQMKISTTAVPNGTVNASYGPITLALSGGVGTVTWRVTAGNLPAGVTLSADGVLAGAPSQAGQFSFGVTATDANGCNASRAFSFDVGCQTITVSPSTVPAATEGVAYSPVTFTQSGGVAPITWVFGAPLPAGMTLSAAGVLSGTPTQAGTFPVTAVAYDASHCRGSQTVTFVVNCQTIMVSPSSLANAAVNTVYGPVTFTETGGIGPAAWSESGALPAGVTCSNGVLSGTPTQSGKFPITVTATDANGCTGSSQETLIVCPVITISPSGTLSGQFVGQSTTISFSATGGTAPYLFSDSGNTDGLGMYNVYSGVGSLAGTPVSAGTFNFTVTVTDANGCTGSAAESLPVKNGGGGPVR